MRALTKHGASRAPPPVRLDALLVRGQSTKGSRIFPHETLRQGQGDLLRQRCSWPRGDGTLPHPLQFPLRRGRVIAGEVIRLTVRLLREQGAPWGPESPASALHTSGSARPISPPPGMMPARQRGFYSEVLDAELEPTSQADLKQVRRAPPSSEPRKCGCLA